MHMKQGTKRGNPLLAAQPSQYWWLMGGIHQARLPAHPTFSKKYHYSDALLLLPPHPMRSPLLYIFRITQTSLCPLWSLLLDLDPQWILHIHNSVMAPVTVFSCFPFWDCSLSERALGPGHLYMCLARWLSCSRRWGLDERTSGWLTWQDCQRHRLTVKPSVNTNQGAKRWRNPGPCCEKPLV